MNEISQIDWYSCVTFCNKLLLKYVLRSSTEIVFLRN